MYWQLHNWTKEGKLLQFDEDIFFRELPDSLRFSIICRKTSLPLHVQRHVHVLDGFNFTIIARITFLSIKYFIFSLSLFAKYKKSLRQSEVVNRRF
jgi:hypothetical protein